MVSVLNSGSSDPGSSPGRSTVLRSRERHLTLTVPLFTHVYKWVPGIEFTAGDKLNKNENEFLPKSSYLLR